MVQPCRRTRQLPDCRTDVSGLRGRHVLWAVGTRSTRQWRPQRSGVLALDLEPAEPVGATGLSFLSRVTPGWASPLPPSCPEEGAHTISNKWPV